MKGSVTMKLTKKLINTIGILTIVAVTAFVTDTVTNVDASVQKEVLTAKGDLSKSQMIKVTIKWMTMVLHGMVILRKMRLIP